MNQKVIIFAVLNWGLGHATRSVPLIRLLKERGCEVIIASDGRAGKLLREEFPHLRYEKLAGYGVSYPFKSMFLNLLIQWPKLIRAMLSEHWSMRNMVKRFQAELIISDNRYGCFTAETINVCMTHQINPLTGRRWLNYLAARCSRLLLANFDHVWIPDDPEIGPLNGKMVEDPPAHARFIGLISRFYSSGAHDKVYDILGVISGPEPARSRFEDLLIQKAIRSGLSFRIVRGRTEGTSAWLEISQHGKSIDFLTSDELEKELGRAHIVVSRSGYTSLMDYLVLGVKALVVPTPGQYEQEFLARHLPRDAAFIGQEEGSVDLMSAWRKLQHRTTAPKYQPTGLKHAVDDLLEG